MANMSCCRALTLTLVLALVIGDFAAGVSARKDGHGCGQVVHRFDSNDIPFGPLTLVRGLRGGGVYALQPAVQHYEMVVDGPGEILNLFVQGSNLKRSFVDEETPRAMPYAVLEIDDGKSVDSAIELLSVLHLQSRILDIERIHSELRRASLQRLQRELQWREAQRAQADARRAVGAQAASKSDPSLGSFWDRVKSSVAAKMQRFREEPELEAVHRQDGSNAADELFGLFHRARDAATSSIFGCLVIGSAIGLLCLLVASSLMALCQCPSEDAATTVLVLSSPDTICAPLLTTTENDEEKVEESGIIENPLHSASAYEPPSVDLATSK